MPAPLYSRLRPTAVRLLGLYGKAATLVALTPSGAPEAPTLTESLVACTVLTTGWKLSRIPASQVQVGDRLGLISPDIGTVPALSHLIELDGVRHKFVALEPLDPGGIALLYEFLARK